MIHIAVSHVYHINHIWDISRIAGSVDGELIIYDVDVRVQPDFDHPSFAGEKQRNKIRRRAVLNVEDAVDFTKQVILLDAGGDSTFFDLDFESDVYIIAGRDGNKGQLDLPNSTIQAHLPQSYESVSSLSSSQAVSVAALFAYWRLN